MVKDRLREGDALASLTTCVRIIFAIERDGIDTDGCWQTVR